MDAKGVANTARHAHAAVAACYTCHARHRFAHAERGRCRLQIGQSVRTFIIARDCSFAKSPTFARWLTADHRWPKRLGQVKNPWISREIWDRWPLLSVGHLWGGGQKTLELPSLFHSGPIRGLARRGVGRRVPRPLKQAGQILSG